MSSKDSNKKNPENSSDIIQKIKRAQNEAYNDLLKYCLNIEPQNDEITYLSYGADFATCSGNVFQEIERFKVRVSRIPLLAVILLWASISRSPINW